ncbi:hypothetical protein DIE18_03755 [Burkholderia sp. Bp9125]|nr:hypothetical protein DIE18_03755 [Burkholderia sp. Bp9125]
MRHAGLFELVNNVHHALFVLRLRTVIGQVAQCSFRYAKGCGQQVIVEFAGQPLQVNCPRGSRTLRFAAGAAWTGRLAFLPDSGALKSVPHLITS